MAQFSVLETSPTQICVLEVRPRQDSLVCVDRIESGIPEPGVLKSGLDQCGPTQVSTMEVGPRTVLGCDPVEIGETEYGAAEISQVQGGLLQICF